MANRPCLHAGMRGPSVVRPGGWSMVHPLRPTDRPKAPIKQGLLQGRKEGRKGRLTFTGRSTVCGAAAEEKMVINQFTTDSLAQFPFPSVRRSDHSRYDFNANSTQFGAASKAKANILARCKSCQLWATLLY